MTRLILHAGTAKTGTSSLQAVLHANQSALREQGVCYPDPQSWLGGANVAHHGFAHVVSRTRRVDVRQAQRLVADLQREVGEHETVILSSEVIYRLPGGAGQWNRMGPRTYWRARLAYLDRLATLLGDFQVEVVLFFRRPDTFAEALYSEYVLNTLGQSDFRRWREERGPLFDYAGQIEAFRTVFPSVTALDYDDARRTGLVRAFSDVVGVRVADPGAWNRRSPDGRVILWMQQRRPGTRKQRYDFAASGESESALRDRCPTTLWTSLEEQQTFLESCCNPWGAAWRTPTGDRDSAELTHEMAGLLEQAWRRWLGDSRISQVAAVSFDRVRPTLHRCRRVARNGAAFVTPGGKRACRQALPG